MITTYLTIIMRYFIILCCLVYTQANAQCSFDPIVTPASLSLCPNQSDTLWSSEADSYLWYKDNDPLLSETNQFIVVNQANDAGSQFRVVATIDDCSEPSGLVAVTNETLPPIQVLVVDSLSLSACQGELRQIYINEPYNLNIAWFRNGFQLSNQTNDTLNVSQNGDYSCLAFAENCPSFSQNSSPVTLSFVNAPVPSLNLNTSSLELSTIVVASSFNWYMNGELIEGANEQVYLPLQNGIVTVEAIYSEGCSKISDEFNYTSFVEICDHDPVVFPNDLVLCPNESDTLFTISGDAYRWFRDDIEMPLQTDSFLIVSSFDAGAEFSAEVTIEGCSEMSEPVLVDSWIFLPLTVITEGIDGSICEEDTLTLKVNEPFVNNIRWSKDGTLIENANETELEVFETGTYTVTAATEVCPLYEETSLDLTYTFLSNPVPELSFFSVSNTIGANVVASNYTWSVDGGILPGLNEQIISPTVDGNYVVNVSYANGCSNMSEPLFYSSVGISDLNSISELILYPNPAKGFIQFKGLNTGLLNIRDISGRLIKSQHIQSESGIIPISDLSSGLYYFDFVTEIGRQIMPIAIQ